MAKGQRLSVQGIAANLLDRQRIDRAYLLLITVLMSQRRGDLTSRSSVPFRVWKDVVACSGSRLRSQSEPPTRAVRQVCGCVWKKAFSSVGNVTLVESS